MLKDGLKKQPMLKRNLFSNKVYILIRGGGSSYTMWMLEQDRVTIYMYVRDMRSDFVSR